MLAALRVWPACRWTTNGQLSRVCMPKGGGGGVACIWGTNRVGLAGRWAANTMGLLAVSGGCPVVC